MSHCICRKRTVKKKRKRENIINWYADAFVLWTFIHLAWNEEAWITGVHNHLCGILENALHACRCVFTFNARRVKWRQMHFTVLHRFSCGFICSTQMRQCNTNGRWLFGWLVRMELWWKNHGRAVIDIGKGMAFVIFAIKSIGNLRPWRSKFNWLLCYSSIMTLIIEKYISIKACFIPTRKPCCACPSCTVHQTLVSTTETENGKKSTSK